MSILRWASLAGVFLFPGSPESLRSPRGPPTRREHRFLCKESGGKESPEGGYPPLDSPKAHPGVSSTAKGFPHPGGAKTKPGAYEQPVVLPAKPGGRRPPTWRGVERGTRSSPLRLFFSPFLFAKRNGALSAQDARPARAKIPGSPGSYPLNRLIALSTPWRSRSSTASAAFSTAWSMVFLSSPWNLPSTQSAMS